MAGSQGGLSETFVKAAREGRHRTRPQRRSKALLCTLVSRERRLQALDDREIGKAKCHRPGRTPFPPAGKRHAHASSSLPSEKAGGRQQLWYTSTCHKRAERASERRGQIGMVSDVGTLSYRRKAAGRRCATCVRRTPAGLRGHLPSVPP